MSIDSYKRSIESEKSKIESFKKNIASFQKDIIRFKDTKKRDAESFQKQLARASTSSQKANIRASKKRAADQIASRIDSKKRDIENKKIYINKSRKSIADYREKIKREKARK